MNGAIISGSLWSRVRVRGARGKHYLLAPGDILHFTKKTVKNWVSNGIETIETSKKKKRKDVTALERVFPN